MWTGVANPQFMQIHPSSIKSVVHYNTATDTNRDFKTGTV